MKKERRVRKQKEFEEIIHKGEKYLSPLYVVYARDKKEEKNRIGISASKKLGNAVVRNRIKRQVRMIVRECNALEIDKDLIVIVRKGYNPNNYQEAKTSFKACLNKIQCISTEKGERE